MEVVSALCVSLHLPPCISIQLTSKVAVNTSNKLARLDLDPFKSTLPGRLLLAVATTAIQLTNFLGVEVLHSQGTAAVMLEYLVICAFGSSAVDVGGAGACFECCGIFADIYPPDCELPGCTIHGSGHLLRCLVQ